MSRPRSPLSPKPSDAGTPPVSSPRARLRRLIASSILPALCAVSVASAAAAASSTAATSAASATSVPGAPRSGGGFEGVEALEGLEARWAEIMDLFDTPGMAVAVVQDGVVHVATLGSRGMDGAPVTPNTMFYIASITKTCTAAAVHLLAAEGKLGLDDPVRRHLPELQLPDSALLETLTVRDLLCHRPGINSGPAVILDAYTGDITEERYFHWLAEAEIAHEVDYTNVHYTLLGRVIEAVAGEPWRDFLERRLFIPAGMTRTTGYASRLWADADHADPLRRSGGDWSAVPVRKTDRTMHAAGGLATSALDGARWLQLFLGHGSLEGTTLLPEAQVDTILTLQGSFPEPDGSIRVIEGFGSAWQVGTFNGHRLASHGGGYTGTSAYCALLPDDDLGVFVLVNAGGPAQGLGTIAAIDVLERLTGTTSPWSVYDRYVAQARAMKADRAETGSEPAADRALEAADLSRPPGLYEGAFHHPWWGTLTVTRDGDQFSMKLGDYPIEIAAEEGIRDAFRMMDLFDNPLSGRFLVTPGGAIEQLVVGGMDDADVVFER